MPRTTPLVIVDNPYHQQTASSRFFLELFAELEPVVLHQDLGEPALLEQLRQTPSAALVFFQIQPKPRLLRALGHRNVTWVPMRDDLRYDASRVRQLTGSTLKFVNFCQEAHRVFEGRGQASLAVQFWPQVPEPPPRPARAAPRIFLWDRGYLQWPLLKQLLGEQAVDSVVLRLSPDPGRQAARPSADDIRRYRIELVEGWLPREDYQALLAGCDLFFAPRPLEGIGMATLEAMALGQGVIAPDRPTMNEYLRTGENGALYDPEQPRPLDLSGWRDWGAQARRDCLAGAERWAAQGQQIVDFVRRPPAGRSALWWRLAATMGV